MIVRVSSQLVMLGVCASVSGCFSSWVPAVGGPGDCATRQMFWFDGDGDGWGTTRVPLVENGQVVPGQFETKYPVDACEAQQERGFTATNDRDCDDGRADITAKIGGVCPGGMVVGVSHAEEDGDYRGFTVAFEGLVDEGVAFSGEDVPVVNAAVAQRACEQWGPWTDGTAFLEPAGLRPGGLPEWRTAFQARETLNQLYRSICPQPSGGGSSSMSVCDGAPEAQGVMWDPDFHYAFFIDAKWVKTEGSYSPNAPFGVDLFPNGVAVAGQWVWARSEEPISTALVDIPFCRAEPYGPADHFPGMNPKLPDEAQAMAERLDSQRLAVVIRDGGVCIGMPHDAIPDGYLPPEGAGALNRLESVGPERYLWSQAHIVCQRDAPTTDIYERIGVFPDEADPNVPL